MKARIWKSKHCLVYCTLERRCWSNRTWATKGFIGVRQNRQRTTAYDSQLRERTGEWYLLYKISSPVDKLGSVHMYGRNPVLVSQSRMYGAQQNVVSTPLRLEYSNPRTIPPSLVMPARYHFTKHSDANITGPTLPITLWDGSWLSVMRSTTH